MPDQVRTYSAHVCTYDHKNNQSNNTNWLRAFALSQIIHALVSTSTHHSQDNWTSVLYVLTGVGTQVRAMIGGIKNACRKKCILRQLLPFWIFVSPNSKFGFILTTLCKEWKERMNSPGYSFSSLPLLTVLNTRALRLAGEPKKDMPPLSLILGNVY